MIRYFLGALGAALLLAGAARADESIPLGVRNEARVTAKDLGGGTVLDLYPDGRVELTVNDEDATGHKSQRTYRADSLGEFLGKYPELAEKYELDSYKAPQGCEAPREAAAELQGQPGEPQEGSEDQNAPSEEGANPGSN